MSTMSNTEVNIADSNEQIRSFMVDFNRNSTFDEFGLPTDDYIIEHLEAYVHLSENGDLVVAPSGAGKTTHFKDDRSGFIDEESIMKLKWPASDNALKSRRFRNVWIDVCTPIVKRVIESGYNVAISVTMSKRIGLWDGTLDHQGDVHIVMPDRDTHLSRVVSRLASKEDDRTHCILKMTREREFLRSKAETNNGIIWHDGNIEDAFPRTCYIAPCDT